MKALSVRQPWAWLIIRPDIVSRRERTRLVAGRDFKDIENRDWRHKPAFRGRFAVHTGKAFDRAGYEYVLDAFPGITMPDPGEFDLGGIIGTVTLVDVVQRSRSPWFDGPLGFVLADPRPTPLVKCPGQLGFYELPSRVCARLGDPVAKPQPRGSRLWSLILAFTIH